MHIAEGFADNSDVDTGNFLAEADYLTITMAEPDEDAVAGLDVQKTITIFSLNPTSSALPSAQTNPLTCPF